MVTNGDVSREGPADTSSTGASAPRRSTRPSLRAKLLVALGSMVFAALGLLVAEAAVRWLRPDINSQDTERSLFRQDSYGNQYGWKPNATGTSFGVPVEIDELGFRRLPKAMAAETDWLLLGDSVTFGVGVAASQTFAGRLQARLDGVRVWNPSVSGYRLINYRNLLDRFLDPAMEPNAARLRKVLLFFVLNDLETRPGVTLDSPGPTGARQPLERLTSILRSHSKLYMLVKDLLLDRSRSHFMRYFPLYNEADPRFSHAIEMLEEMHDAVQERGAEFVVVGLPYEYQLRTRSEQSRRPQRLMQRSLEELGVRFIDAYDYLARHQGDAEELFLFMDSMHLSPTGHELVFRLLVEELEVR